MALQLVGRARELEALDGIAEALRHGESRTVVLVGSAGIGKTAILDWFAESHPSWQIRRGSGVECEMEFAWAALHQLCAPLLVHLPKIPAPQRDALRAAFGLAPRGTPDPFLCGLAVLNLLAEASESGPVVWVIDDAHTLDRESLKTLGFVARRIGSESVGILFATRTPLPELAKIPTMPLDRLTRHDAAALLDRAMRFRLDPAVREQVLSETAGNPLAIVEFAGRGNRRPGEGPSVPDGTRATAETSFQEAIARLSPQARAVLLIAAAEPTADAALVQRAARLSGAALTAEDDARLTPLVVLAPVVRFRHPLVRSVAYDSASEEDRRDAHRALADALDAEAGQDRQVWHRARSLDHPDEEVAADLERAAGGARSRGGWGAAAAFLALSAQLTPESPARARRLLEAARARFQAGDADGALALAVSVQTYDLDELLRARLQLLRGQAQLYLTRGGDGAALLLGAARELSRLQPELARETFLEAIQAAGFANSLPPGVTVQSIALAALAEAPVIDPPRPVDLLMDAAARFYADGAAAATSAARAANAALLAEPPSAEVMQWTVLGANLAFEAFDDELFGPLANRAAEIARQTGMVSLFVMAGWVLVGARVMTGEFAEAEDLLQDVLEVAEDIGASPPTFALLGLRAWRGAADGYEQLESTCRAEAREHNEGHVLRFVDGITALLRNGLGDHETALALCRRMLETNNPTYGLVVAFEYAEAAAKAADGAGRTAALEYVRKLTSAAATGWARGLGHTAEALLGPAAAGEEHFRQGIAEFSRTPLRPYLARVHLLFGEWLLAAGRRAEARSELRAAYDLLSHLGCAAFAARAAQELGLPASAPPGQASPFAGQLTSQELRVARMAAAGLSNREIADRLYLSHRTIASHLYRIYPKLGISSRGELGGALTAHGG